MKILFLDDSTERIKVMKNNFGKKPNRLDVAETSRQAVHLLKKNSPYDMVMLDHDLGIESRTTRIEETGFQVAKFITTLNTRLQPARIVIHTHNPVGAQRIKALLDIHKIKCEISPFSVRMFQ